MTSTAEQPTAAQSIFDLLCTRRRNCDTAEWTSFTVANRTAILQVGTDILITVFVMDITVNNDLLAQDSGVTYRDGCQRGDSRGNDDDL